MTKEIAILLISSIVSNAFAQNSNPKEKYPS